MLEKYIKIIHTFLDRKITADEFEAQYNMMYEQDNEDDSDEVFDILDGMFADIDAYCAEYGPEDEADPYCISEPTLRKRAQIALDRLSEILKQQV